MNSWGALFDWDGVIIDSSRQHEESWERLAAEENRTLPADHFVRGFGRKNEMIIPGILNWSSDPDDIQRLSLRKEALYREIVRERGIDPLPGVIEFLTTLKERGIPACVGSSTHRENIVTILDVAGLRPFFDKMVTAEDVSHGKPDPEVFLKAAGKLRMPPAQCVVFEDALVGIEAGQRSGARVVAVATTHALHELQHADLAVPQLSARLADTISAWF